MSTFAHLSKSRVAALSGAALAVLAVLPAVAADSPKTRAPALQAVVDCRKLSDAAERLACYDKATAGLEAAEAAGDVVVVDREQVREAQRSAFGFNFRMPSFMTGGGGGAKGEVLETLDSEVASARQVGGKWRIVLPDGAVWNQTDNEILSRPPTQGSKVAIRKGAMGGYFLSVDGQKSFRTKREN